jgi:MFS family permease
MSLIPNAYLDLLRRRPARLPLLASVIGRLPYGAGGLAMIVLIQHATGSFASAGAAEAAFAIGVGSGVPLQGRIVDRFGQTSVLVASGILNGAASVLLVIAAHGGWSLAALAAISLLAGLTSPPISPCLRSLLAELLRGDEDALQSAYALDAVIIELAFIFGPLITAALIALGSAEAAVLLSGALGSAGALLLAFSTASRRWRGSRHERRHWAGALSSPGILVLAAAAVAFGGGIAAMELAVIAYGKVHYSAAIAGPLISIQALASLAGGFWFGARSWTLPLVERFVRLNSLVALGFLPLLLVPSLPLMSILMLLTGFGLAPLSATSYALIDRLAPPGTRTEAFGWLITATMLGNGAGAALGGAIVNGGQLRLGFLTAFAAMTAAWLIALAGRRLLAGRAGRLTRVAA